MRDLHDGFAAWIAGGARDELRRDVALHASGCDDCLRQAAAFDALLAVDPGAAPLPPVRTAPMPRSNIGPMRLARAAAGAMVIVIVLGAGAITGTTLFRPRATEPPVSAAEPTSAEGILGGVPASSTPSPTPVPTASANAAPSASSSLAAKPTTAVAATTPRPPMGGAPPPISTARPATPTPVPATPQPSPAPTVAPSAAATPAPTPDPTPDPTPSPTAAPTATPTLSPSPDPTPTCETDCPPLP